MTADSPVAIVAATAADAEAILALQKRAYEREAQRYQDWTIRHVRTKVLSPAGSLVFLRKAPR